MQNKKLDTPVLIRFVIKHLFIYLCINAFNYTLIHSPNASFRLCIHSFTYVFTLPLVKHIFVLIGKSFSLMFNDILACIFLYYLLVEKKRL